MRKDNQDGLTLVELMVVLLLSAIVSGAMYSLYTVQQKSTVIQTQVAEMQQNLRAGLDTVLHDIRMAGYAMQDDDKYGVSDADSTSMTFTYDVNDDGGDPGTTEQFKIYVLGENLLRTSGGEAVAENVEQIEFCYYVRRDEDGDGGNGKEVVVQVIAPSVTDRDNIWAVDVSLLVRSNRPSSNYLNQDTYATPCGSAWSAGNDNFRRRFFSKRVVLRNTES